MRVCERKRGGVALRFEIWRKVHKVLSANPDVNLVARSSLSLAKTIYGGGSENMVYASRVMFKGSPLEHGNGVGCINKALTGARKLKISSSPRISCNRVTDMFPDKGKNNRIALWAGGVFA